MPVTVICDEHGVCTCNYAQEQTVQWYRVLDMPCRGPCGHEMGGRDRAQQVQVQL